MDPLKTINIPDTETMRSFSQHFQASVAPYEQHLNTLEKNQEPVAANWQGDASEAYGKTNPQLVSIGHMHIEQMQQASHIFDHTANLFDEGKGLQDMAQWQWGMGRAAETALAFPVAASWYILAQKTQEGAQAMVESARAYFNSGFAALNAQITATPGVTSMHDKTFEPHSVSVPKDAEPYAGHLPTPPLTPPATPPLKPAASQLPVLGATGVPPSLEYSAPSIPLSEAGLKPLVAGVPEPTPEALPQASPSTETELLASGKADAPPAYDAVLVKEGRNLAFGAVEGEVGVHRVQPGLALGEKKPWTWSDQDLYALKHSQFGTKALERIKQYNVKVIEGRAGQGSFYDPAKNTITLDPQEKSTQSTFVHESNHVEFYWRQKNAGFWAKTEEAYVNGMFEEEARGQAEAIQHVMDLRLPEKIALQTEYVQAYDAARAAHKERNPEGSLEDLRAAGMNAGYEAVLAAFHNDEVAMSGTGKSYGDYIRKLWRQHRPQSVAKAPLDPPMNALPTAGIRPAPGDPQLQNRLAQLQNQLAQLNASISTQEASRGRLLADSRLYAQRVQIQAQIRQLSTQSVAASTSAQMAPAMLSSFPHPMAAISQQTTMPLTNMLPPNVFPSTGASPVPEGTSPFSRY